MPDEGFQIHLNPGSVPEARQLAKISDELATVRDLVARESIGAVSPRQQLFFVDSMMQKHHDALAQLIAAAARRNNRVLAPDDTYQLIVSLLGHAATAGYWLEIARDFRQIPVRKPPPAEMSISKSRQYREDVLSRIRTSASLGLDMMRRLAEIAPPTSEVARFFSSLSLQFHCIQINAYLSARHSASKGAPIPKHQLDHLAQDLQVIRSDPSFASRSLSEQNMVFLALARIYEHAGRAADALDAVRDRVALTVRYDEARPRVLKELLGFSPDRDEQLAALAELRDFPEHVDLGPVFSRERLGGMSVLGDTFWSSTNAIPEDDPRAAEAFAISFAGMERWLFGKTFTPVTRTISISTGWHGHGRVGWFADGEDRLASFDLPPQVVTALFAAMDRADNDLPKALRSTFDYLDATVAPLLDKVEISGQWRVRIRGLIGLVPLLATVVDGAPLGASPEVALHHPGGRSPALHSSPRAFDLIVVDECFGDHATRVASAGCHAAGTAQPIDVLRFNSDRTATAIDRAEFLEHLDRARRPLIYSHVRSAITQANWAGIVLGPTSVLSVEELVSLDLRGVEEIALIGCASGRANPFVGDVTVAHAAALAGVEEVFFSLWPIRPRLGADIAEHLIDTFGRGESLSEGLAALFRADRAKAAPFAVMRP